MDSGCVVVLVFWAVLGALALAFSDHWPWLVVIAAVALIVTLARIPEWRRRRAEQQARLDEAAELAAQGRSRGTDGRLRLAGPPLLLPYERTRLDPAGFSPRPAPSSLWLPQPPGEHIGANGMTEAEESLWQHLQRSTQTVWVAQHRAGDIRLDFVSLAAGVVVEVDDPGHFDHDHQIDDAHRDAALISRGFRVVRFTNKTCRKHPDTAAASINSLVSSRNAAYAAGTLRRPDLDNEPYAGTRLQASQAASRPPRAASGSSSSPQQNKTDLLIGVVYETASRSPDGTFTHADVFAVVVERGLDGVIGQSTARTYVASMLNVDSQHHTRPVVRRVATGRYRLAGT